MGTFFKKDMLVFWRDRKEVLIGLLLPILLIVVLNLAFSNLFNNNQDSLDIHVGIVEDDNFSLGLKQFEETINNTDLPQVDKEMIPQQASNVNPSQMLFDFFNNPELAEIIHTRNVSEAEAIELVENGELHAFIKIPKGFTSEILSSIMLGEEADVVLSIQAEEQSTELRTLQNMLTQFIDMVNLQFALGTTSGQNHVEPILPEGGIEVIEGVETFNFSQYITIAMCTLFALFIAQTVATKTMTEKRELVFNRIILTNSNPLQFLMGKVFATFCLAWLQLMITFVFSQLIFNLFPNKSIEFWFGVLIFITVYAFIISGLAAIFTSLTLHLKDPNAANGVITLIIMAMAVIGGNFAPKQILPVFIQKIGEWTPNGLTLTTLLHWIQFENLEHLVIPFVVLVGFFVVCLVIGMAMFPKRGVNS